MAISVKVEDHSDEVKEALEQAKERALEAIGLAAEGYAKLKTPVDTGRLRNSISHAVSGDSAYIGTNVEYAPYVEYGTSKMLPKHYLKSAATEHNDEYKDLIMGFLKGNA